MPMPICSMRRCTFAAPLMVLAAFSPSDASARAATECIAAPKGTVARGSHWYYRWDRAAQRKCWYVAAWKDRTVRAAQRVTTASARTPVQQVANDPSPVTKIDEAAQEDNQERIRRFLYGTEQPVDAGVPPQVELRPSLAPAQTADAGDGMRSAMSAAFALQSTPADAPDEVTIDAFIPVPPRSATRTITPAGTGGDATVTPAQMMLFVVTTLAIAGGLLHVTGKLLRAQRRRSRIDRRSAYVVAASRRTQSAAPPDRVRRFA